MKHVPILIAAVILAGSVVNASTMCVNDASLATYISGGSTRESACQIGDKLFWGFTLTSGPDAIGAEPAATDIQVQTFPGDGLTNTGIAFNTGGWSTSNGIPIDSIISYSVATVSGAPIIKDATLTITGQLTGTGGRGTVTETLNPAVAASPIIAAIPTPVVVNIDFSDTKQSSFSVINEISLLGGRGYSDVDIRDQRRRREHHGILGDLLRRRSR
jgi:hypothetical protein